MTENDYIAEYVKEKRPEILCSFDYITWRFSKSLDNILLGFSDAIDKCLKEVRK